MAAGDVLWEGDRGYQWAVVEVPTAAGGIARAPGLILLNAAGVATTPLSGVTEDAAAVANPIGPQIMARRKDTLSAAEVTTDGDHIALNATSKGELHTRNLALEALLPTALAANGGLKIEGIAGGVAVPTTGPMTSTEFLANLRSTGAFTSVNSGAASVTILAVNAARKGAIIVNTDANALYLDLTGGTATTTTRYATSLATGDEYEVPFGLTGLITGIWAADGAGAALVTEFS